MSKTISYWLMGTGGLIVVSIEYIGTLFIKLFGFRDEPWLTVVNAYLAYGDYIAIAGFVLLVFGFVLYERSRPVILDPLSPWRRFGVGWFFKWGLILFSLNQLFYFPIAALFIRLNAAQGGVFFFESTLYLALLFLMVGMLIAVWRFFGRRV